MVIAEVAASVPSKMLIVTVLSIVLLVLMKFVVPVTVADVPS